MRRISGAPRNRNRPTGTRESIVPHLPLILSNTRAVTSRGRDRCFERTGGSARYRGLAGLGGCLRNPVNGESYFSGPAVPKRRRSSRSKFVISRDRTPTIRSMEIGRASCRERMKSSDGGETVEEKK